MAGRSWEPTRKGAKELNRWLTKGATVYTINNMATNLAPYEDAQTYSAHTFDRRSMISGEWMTGHLSASGLLGQCGTVYERPPAGMRDIATPGRQYAAPTSQSVLDRLASEDRPKTRARSRR
ncbi:hypothetical protein ABZ876_08310 [Streptomyces sp. NPDC046931]|uniref:hypothetical protein n=1 Tax=Streptomyces sp. NPDC046931 TaxID=3154806 RepID=UPI0033EAC3CC